MSKLTLLKTKTCCRPYAFIDVVASVTLTDGTQLEYTLDGVIYSEYRSGPGLFLLADAVSEVLNRVKFVGLKSARYLESL